ncbi:MAG: hypothetical protein HZC54_19215 [Verrucomicrobia bacterium]|nr:hypothetical protein [Verrucomicrobiota bacterium]
MAQDYIMRLVEQIGRMLAAIIAHRKAGRDAEAALEIEANCRQAIGLPLEIVRRSSPEALWELLQQGGGLRYPRAVMLAELLLQDAELSKSANRPADTICSQLQAFCLLTESIGVLSHDEAAFYRPRLEALANELEASSSDPYLQQKLHAYRTQKTA